MCKMVSLSTSKDSIQKQTKSSNYVGPSAAFHKPTRTALHTSISLVHMISKMQMVLIKLNQVSTP